MRESRGAGGMAWAALLALASCTKPRTELVVTVRTDLAWGPGAGLRSLRVRVRNGDSHGYEPLNRPFTLGPGTEEVTLPMPFGLYPTDPDEAALVWIQVVACNLSDCDTGNDLRNVVAVQRAAVRYRPQQTAGIDLWLGSTCGLRCGPDERCVRETGLCESAILADQDVRPWSTADAGDATDAGVPRDVSPADRAPDATVERDVTVEPDVTVDASPDVVDVPVVMDVLVDTGPPDTGPPDTGPPDTGPPPCTTLGMTCPCSPTNAGGYCSPGAACTGGRCVAGTLASSLVITEVMNDPSVVSDDFGEWFEVYNLGATPLDLRGVRLSNSRMESHTITATAPVVLGPRAYGVLARNGSPALNGGVSALYAYAGGLALGTLQFSNSSLDVVILDLGSTAVEIDRVAYDGSTGSMWPRSVAHSKSLSPTMLNASANDMPLNWCNAPAMLPSGDYGSPGAANPACP